MTLQINLLPHREMARQKQRLAFQRSLVLAVLLGLAAVLVIYLWLQGQISDQQRRNQLLQAENLRLDGQIKEVAQLEQEIAALRSRQQAVEGLQADRNLSVHLLSQLVIQLPEGLYLTQLKQDNDVLQLQGVAQSNERVSELLRNLGGRTPWLAQPELVEIVAAPASLGGRDARRVANFTLRVKLVRGPQTPAPAVPQTMAPAKNS